MQLDVLLQQPGRQCQHLLVWSGSLLCAVVTRDLAACTQPTGYGHVCEANTTNSDEAFTPASS